MTSRYSSSPTWSIACVAVVAFLGCWFDWFSSVDKIAYDFLLRQHLLEYPDDVVIVAIDEDSIDALGAWPWDRRHHAKLLEKLKEADAVVFDIIFSEPQSDFVFETEVENKLISGEEIEKELIESSDMFFAAAIESNNNVFLPMFIEQQYSGLVREILPIPGYAGAAAGLGHVNINYDSDGNVRGVFLRQGLGVPYWQHISLVLSEYLGEAEGVINQLSADSAVPSVSVAESPYEIAQSQFQHIRFAGREGTFFSFSYKDVLEDVASADHFKHKKVFIGATAKGLGDDIPTPLGVMSGVEFQANVYQALRTAGLVSVAGTIKQSIFNGLLAMLVCFFLSRLAPSQFLIGSVSVAIAWLFVVSLLFYSAGLWLRPLPFLVALALFYPLWSLRRIVLAMSFLRDELDELKKSLNKPQASIDKINSAIEQLLEVGVLQKGLLSEKKGGVELTWPEYSVYGRSFQTAFMLNNDRYELNLKSTISAEHAQMVAGSLLSNIPITDQDINGAHELVEKTIEEIYQFKRVAEQAQLRMDHSMMRLQDAVLVCDAAGKIIFANEQAITLFNESFDGASIFLLREKFDALIWPALIRAVMVDCENIYQEIDGPENKRLLCQASQVQSETGVQETLIFIFTNVTQLRALEQSKNEALAFLSHDMRSPIVSQLSLIESYKTDASRDGLKEPLLLESLKEFAEKSLKYSEDFLQLSRAENLEQEQFQLVDMHGVVDSAYAQILYAAQKADVDIYIDRTERDCWLLGDAQLLERAVTNLLSNAIQYSPRNSQVSLLLIFEEDILVKIADEGIGIDQQEIPYLFEPYFRVKRDINSQRSHESIQPGSATNKNYGLGLSFVHSVVQRHGGKIDIKSQIGEGTEFTLRFPSTPID